MEKNDNNELMTIYESLIKDEDLSLALKVNRGFKALQLLAKVEAKLKAQQQPQLQKAEAMQEVQNDEELQEEVEIEEPELPKVAKIKPYIKPQQQQQMPQQQVVRKPLPMKQVPQKEEEEDFPLDEDEFP